MFIQAETCASTLIRPRSCGEFAARTRGEIYALILRIYKFQLFRPSGP